MFVARVQAMILSERGSCPRTWCSFGGLITAFSGLGRVDQAATAGSPTTGSSLKGAVFAAILLSSQRFKDDPKAQSELWGEGRLGQLLFGVK